MDAIDAMLTRRSVRSYLSLPVEWEKVGFILNAGRSAPSAGNLQNYKFVILLEREQRELAAELCRQQYWMSQAPVHIIVCVDTAKESRDFEEEGAQYAIADASAVIENILIAAHAQGLGACWVGTYELDKLRSEFSIPGNVLPVGIVTIGYPTGNIELPPKKPLNTLVYFRKYGSKVNNMHEMTGQYSDIVTNVLHKAKELVSGKKK